MKDIFILGIETSCDETSASIVKNGREVVSNVISSQVDLHIKYGGVVPEIASRKHVELIIPVIDQAVEEAGMRLEELDAIAVTYGPGLVGALLVGVSAAKALAFTIDKPLIAVNHIEGHIAANYIQHKDLEPPFVCLVVSGGHSHIVYVKDYGEYEILGRTRDDAAGEAFDKVARALGMGYPGGPLIDKAAKDGNAEAINFPRVYFEKGCLDFSFSGIKTAVLNYINVQTQKGEGYKVEDVCASFQWAVVEVLINNLITAAKLKGVSKVALAGGVAANSCLRSEFIRASLNNDFKAYYPSPILCTDNAAMIASSAYYRMIKGKVSDLYLNAVPALKLGKK
ncbi:tRNA (adenosine(37)-N6)-threonylcarbamoyltransferase complex transferase subunit TsaD [Acetivibrio saccincola]|uniref:tRNA N6-adenosine threonylcarbamoyltransferase n=1 Tax=Acetivibrio saccincola TaxID=1677857 RepID=A0A2S8R952_9FIRM|nr:tRNA (adenosine(37)-N6)-threonylcarbamoyltransferase complex transferase subunit TsaD [Acetivibrio saccincola]PQQ66314.1 tRNA (adenosine(37)-N6)-threonylcarbamoyltransferase complex transferase subunit TsaD [Acetivibrio saccincola]